MSNNFFAPKPSLLPEHARLIVQISDALSSPGAEAFSDALMVFFRDLAEHGPDVIRDLREHIEPLLARERQVGYVTALLDVQRRVMNIAKKYNALTVEDVKPGVDAMATEDLLLARDHSVLGEAFTKLAERLMEHAKVKAAPVMELADQIRSANKWRN